MRMLDRVTRGHQIPEPLAGTSFSLARLLGQEAYDTDPIKTDSDALKSYSGWVYACVSTISQDVRSSTWKIWQKSGASREDWKALDATQLPEILTRPTPSQTWGDLIELTQVHLDLAGRAFWHLITTGPGGPVVGIQVLNPDWVTKAVYDDKRTKMVGWEILSSGSTRRIIPAEDVVMFRYPDPVDPTSGVSPIRAVAMSADMDTYSRAYAASHLRNHAQPTGILTTEAELTRDQATLLAESWKDVHQGTSNIQVLGKGAQFQTLSAHIKDLEFLNLARVSRDQILAAYHVPATKLGLVEDSSRANGEEADRVYSSLCLGPRLRRFQEPISYRVLPRLGLSETQYAFEFDPVEVGDKEFDRTSAEAAFQAGAITMDEYRERIGFDPEANGKGAVYFVPLGSSVVADPEEASSFVENNPESEPEPPVTETPEVEEEEEEEEEESRSLEEPEDRELVPSEDQIQIAALRFLSAQGEAERRMKGRIRAVFSKMQKAVSTKLKKSRSADGVETRAPYPDVIEVLEGFSEEMQEILEEEAYNTFGEGFETFNKEIASSVSSSAMIDFALVSEQTKYWAAREAAEKIVDIADVSKSVVREIISDSIEQGQGVHELAQRLSRAFDEWKGVRAETIARTETAGSYNFGKFTNAQTFGEENPEYQMVKTWVPTQDDRTRKAHRSGAIQTADGRNRRSVFQNQPFRVGGELMMRPLDPNASAENVINCRCVLTYSVAEGVSR